MYKQDYSESNISLSDEYNCKGIHTHCNMTVPFIDIKIGVVEHFYVTLYVKHSTNMVCQGYNMPQLMQSKETGIHLNEMVGKWL